MCLDLGVQDIIRLRRIVICGLSRLYNILPHYLIKGIIFGKEHFLTQNVCFVFSNICLQHFSFEEEVTEILSKIYFGLRVK